MRTSQSRLARLSLLTVLGAGFGFAAPSPMDHAEGFVPPAPDERLGAVSFATSCSPQVQASFSRGVALLHDFWYGEAQRQFEEILRRDPNCAMAHWGVAMSVFHQIWDRPSPHTRELAHDHLTKAAAHPAKTARERAYVAALGGFFELGSRPYEARIEAYSAAMAKLYADNPTDVDAGAFYALSLLAAESPDDTSLRQEREAMAVLTPLLAAHPDNPGLVHYTIHACDNPSMARDGLAAARHYGEIAPSGPHAVHMPGHIFARLGMWQEDIAVNRASVADSKAAEARHQHGSMDQFHSDDFLLYAYLQIAQDEAARGILADSNAMLAQFESMPEMGDQYMVGMFPYYRTKLPVFFDLEMRDWTKAAALEPVAGAPPQDALLTFWARAVADGHLHHADRARADVAQFDASIAEIRKGDHAYMADSVGSKIVRGEMQAWTDFAAGARGQAISEMREAADLQDKVGQGEVDIPAREMLGDLLLEAGRPKEALTEYQTALKLSPNRFNGLYQAGLAAEAAGDKAGAGSYFRTLLKQSDGGAHSTRTEFAHAKAFVSATTLAER